jgi:intein/homing endonuclease
MADGTNKPIEAVRAGDVVASYDPLTGNIVSARVIALSVHGPETSKDGFLVIGGARVTPNHPLFVDGVKRRADSLRADATRTVLTVRERSSGMLASYDPSVIALSPRARPVGMIELLPGNGEQTYDLQVEGSGTFVAGGVVAAHKRFA